jgi:hypothetical protein
MPRQILCILLLLAAACRTPSSTPPIRIVDLIGELNRAEKRPPDAFTLSDRNGVRAIAGPAPGRLIWTLPIPRRAVFRAMAAVDGRAPARFRVGVSDDRIYEGLSSVQSIPGGDWTPIEADLSAYAGWKWSLFYRPERRSWRLVLSADAVGGAPTTAVWGNPEILSDPSSAREYARRTRHR